MPRVKRKPLRGSVQQNTAQDNGENWMRFFGFWPRLALLVVGCIALIILTGWLWNGQWPRAKRHELKQATLEITQDIGFAIEDVTVEGRHYTDKKDILLALGISAGAPIYSFNPHNAQANIIKLPWVKSASILRSLPNRIIITIKERAPVAQWKRKNNTVIIDTDGTPISAASVSQFPSLPLIIGDVKPEQTKKLISILQEFPLITQRLKSAVRIAKRRWDLRLHPHITVRLPQQDVSHAMKRLKTLIKKQKIASRGVKAIDLRLRDKIFIEPIARPDAGE